MKSILGKILFVLFFSLQLFASSIHVSVSSPVIYKGDTVSLTITIKGDSYTFPNITQIGGYNILGVSSSSSTTIINGDVSKSVSKIYTFKPLKSVIIPSYKIKIDGKTYQTKQIKIDVIKPSKSKNGDDFVINLNVKDKNLKVGQSTRLTIIFKHKLDAKANKINLDEPKIEHFWVKRLQNEDKKYAQGEYIVQEFVYKITAQKAGQFHIDQIEAQIGHLVQNRQNGFMNAPFFNDPFFSSITAQIKWDKIYSNSLDLDVKPLPQNIEIYGDFSLDASVNKKTIYVNKPVNLTISIKGSGNIDDIKKFELNIPQAIVYSDEPKIINNQFTQKIAIIASNDFMIPSIKFKYFDKNTQTIKTLKTKEIKIKVSGAKDQNQIKLEKNDIVKKQVVKKSKTSKKGAILTQTQTKYLIVGIVLLVVLFLIYYYFKNRKLKPKKPKHITVQIQKAKTDQELYNILLPYAKDDKVVANILELLERNIYKNENNKINKQELYDLFL